MIDYNDNPRNNDEAVDYVKASIKQFGFKVPIVVDRDYVIIAGHTRKKAALEIGIKEVPVIVADDLTPEQVTAFRLADNKVAEFSEWDEELLMSELNLLEDMDMSDFGFDLDDSIEDVEVEEDDFEEEPPEDPVAETGQIYQLGKHRLMCGDSTSEDDVNKLMNGKKAELVFTDPPYGAKKESDGVLNDNLNFDELLEFNKKWIKLSFNSLEKNGSWYCWGMDEPLMDIYSEILKPKIKKEEIVFRNLITWDKGSGQGQNSELSRMYAPADEKCLFVMCGKEKYNNNSDNFFEGYSELLEKLKECAEHVGLNSHKYKEIIGNTMYSHYFTKSQFKPIPKKDFMKLKEYYGSDWYLTWEEINGIAQEADRYYSEEVGAFRSTRSYFNNTHDNFNNVWHINRVSAGSKEYEEKGEHATPKPIFLCSRGILTSSQKGGIVLDLFGGSGSVLVASEQTERTCYMMEYQPEYIDAIIKRWEQYTGEEAVLIDGKGQSVDGVEETKVK